MKLTITRESNAKGFGVNVGDTINIHPETYLLGCVPSEMNGPDEAVKAQAIAARTNAYAIKSMTDNSAKHQAYRYERAISSSYEPAHKCVEATNALVLTYKNVLCNTAPFSASNGGHIKSSKEVWGGDRAWLVSKADPYTTEARNGHCVGMSQAGAKRMAKTGYNYLDILQFYYPGTVVKEVFEVMTSQEKEKVIREYALSKEGCGYIYGAQGQTATESFIRARMAQYPDKVDYDIVKKWLGKQVFDCEGFTKLCFAQVSISLVSGASSQWKSSIWVRKGPIDQMPKDKICALYHESPTSNPMSHTGVYLGDGTFMHAAGSKTGVKRQDLGTYTWTHYAIPEGLYTPEELADISTPEGEVLSVLYQASVKSKSGSTVRMRQGPGTNYNTGIISLKTGTIVDVIDHGTEWDRIVYNGKTGYMMTEFLIPVLAPVEPTPAPTPTPDGPKSWYVKVACSSESEARELVAALQKVAKATATT